ncbi:hypothetical protein [Streptomyces misionensis]|uniref:hypothetical protein n=1 Tax=Streptomyces misionensis TaxID=67331 RepID=UPI0036BF125A
MGADQAQPICSCRAAGGSGARDHEEGDERQRDQGARRGGRPAVPADPDGEGEDRGEQGGARPVVGGEQPAQARAAGRGRGQQGEREEPVAPAGRPRAPREGQGQDDREDHRVRVQPGRASSHRATAQDSSTAAVAPTAS